MKALSFGLSEEAVPPSVTVCVGCAHGLRPIAKPAKLKDAAAIIRMPNRETTVSLLFIGDFPVGTRRNNSNNGESKIDAGLDATCQVIPGIRERPV